jgi:hypothetical protein
VSRSPGKGGGGVFVGVSITALIHLSMVAAFMSRMNEQGCGEASAAGDADDSFAETRVIEASLARKKVDPKNKQPQKRKKEKYQPTELLVSRDEELTPEPDKKDKPDHKVAVLEDEIDVTSVLEKNRSQDETLSSTGADETPTEGSETGSIWGTERESKDHPYLGELYGRIHSEWRVPSLETRTGATLGCVKLNEAGKIVDTRLKQRSGIANLDRSVTLALKKAPAMDKPVPDELKQDLIVRGVCFRFNLD